MGLVEDFTDDMFEGRSASGELSSTLDTNRSHAEDGHSAPVASSGWALEDLAARARVVEEELRDGNTV